MMNRIRFVAAAFATVLTSVLGVVSVPASAAVAPPVLAARVAPALTWSALVNVGGPATGISCPSSTFCAVTSSQAAEAVATTTTTAGVTIATFPSNFTADASCASATFCMQVGSDSFFRTWNGKSWAAKKRFAKGNRFSRPNVAVSCASKSFCVATDTYLNVFTWRGSSWKKTAHPKLPEALSGQNGFDISCASKRHCLILATNAEVPGAAYASAWNGKKWSVHRKILPAGTLTFSGPAVSCTPKGSFCVAAANGTYATWRGGRWSSARSVKGFQGLSCVTSAYCVGVRGKQASTFNGSSWSALKTIDDVDLTTSGGLGSVSCPSTRFCAASDFSGNIVVGRRA